jgi:hypothetical protein
MSQEFFAYLLIFLAAATLAHRLWSNLSGRGASGCGGSCRCGFEGGSAESESKLGKRKEIIPLHVEHK